VGRAYTAIGEDMTSNTLYSGAEMKGTKLLITSILLGLLFLSGVASATITEYTYGTASASVTHAGSAAGAFNNNLGDFWQSEVGNYLQMDYGSGVSRQINRISISGGNSWGTYAPREFTFLGSTDGSTWVTLYIANETDAVPRYSNAEVKYFTFNNPNSYRYYRIYGYYSDYSGGRYVTDGALLIAELEMFYDDDANRNVPDFIIGGGEYQKNWTVAYDDWSPYSYRSVSVFPGNPVEFTDHTSNSTGPITDWYWEFGNGATSTDRNPQYTYTNTGNYRVNLTTKVNGVNASTYRYVRVVNVFDDPVYIFGFGNTPTAIQTQAGSTWNAFNHNTGDMWQVAVGSYNDPWIQQDYGHGVIKNGFYLSYGGSWADYGPRNFKILASNDNTNWVTLYDTYANWTKKLAPRIAASNSYYYYFNNSDYYRYYRLQCGPLTQQYTYYADGSGLLIPEMDFIYSNPVITRVDITVDETIANMADYRSYSQLYTLLPGTAYTFNSSLVVNSSPIVSYKWDINNDGVTDGTEATYSFTPTWAMVGSGGATSYTAKLNVTDANGVETSKTVTYAVYHALEPIYSWYYGSFTASNTNSGAPRYAFDGTGHDGAGDIWYTTSTGAQWIAVDYRRPVVINEYIIRPSAPYYQYMEPRLFFLEASTDNTNWVPLENRLNQYNKVAPMVYGDPSFFGGYYFHMGFENTNAYRYYRFRVNATNPTIYGSGTQLSEIYLRYHAPGTDLIPDVSVTGPGYFGIDTYQLRQGSTGYQAFTVMVNKSFTLTDTSSGAPTSWQWDVNNDGNGEYLTKDVTLNYNTVGTRTMRLTVSDGVRTYTRYFYLNVVSAIEYPYWYGDSGGAASASVTSAGNANHAFDGNAADGSGDIWYVATNAYPDQYIQVLYGMGHARVINEVTLRISNSYLHYNVRQFSVYGSNDGSAWTALDTRYKDGNMLMKRVQSGDNYLTLNFINTNAYRYYRIVVNRCTVKDVTYGWTISEVYLKYHDPTDFIDPLFSIDNDGIVGYSPSQWDYLSSYAYSYDPLSAMTNRPVQFRDRSLGEPSTYLWNFGDGTTSTLQTPPPHTYTTAGEYLVTLTITRGQWVKTKTSRLIVRGYYEYPTINDITKSSSSYGVSASHTNAGNIVHIFDGDRDGGSRDIWYAHQSNAGVSPYFTIDFGNYNSSQKRLVNRVQLYSSGSYTWGMPTVFTISGSNDGSNWVKLENRTEDSRRYGIWATGYTWYTYNFKNTEPYRYYRLNAFTNGYIIAISEASFLYVNPEEVLDNDFYINRSWRYENAGKTQSDYWGVFKNETVEFIDASITTNATYSWDFNGDGIVDSTKRNDTYVFPSTGTYTVTHKVMKNGQTSSLSRYVYANGAIEPRYGLSYPGTSYSANYAASASNTYSSYYPFGAFDHSLSYGGNTIWMTNAAPPQYLTIDYGGGNTLLYTTIGWQPPTITHYSLTNSNSASSTPMMPRSWEIRGSNNGSVWDVLDTQTSVPAWSTSENRVYYFNEPKTYRYFRFYVTAITSGSNVCIPEWNLFYNANQTAATEPPQASFTQDKTYSDHYGTLVSFTDTSSGTSSSRLWDFGDGYTSTELHPKHWYSTAGNYTITLTETNVAGSTNATSTFELGSDWDNQVETWLMFNGASGSTSILDRNSENTWQANGNAQISNAQVMTDFGNGSLYLDGSSDISLVNSSHGFIPTEKAATIELWFKRSNTVGEVQTLVSKGNLSDSGWALYLASNKITFRANQQSPASQFILNETGTTADTNWHMLVMQKYTNGTWMMLKDGSLSAASNWAGTITSNSQPLRIGGSDFTSHYYFPGYIECFRYSSELPRWDTNLFSVPKREYQSSTQSFVVLYAPLAGFTTTNKTAADVSINITDTSTQVPQSWEYSFGDGTPNSTDQNPTHAYAGSGQSTLKKDYTLTQVVSNTIGSSTATQTITVYKFDENYNKSVDFSANLTTAYKGAPIAFTDLSKSDPTAWWWDFGDNTNSTQQNPVHTYTQAGNKTVNLTITTEVNGATTFISKSNYLVINEKVEFPVANFTAAPRIGVPGMTVQFHDYSENEPNAWQWDFENDGSIDSTDQHPSHVYSSPGTYTVKLKAFNPFGDNTTIRTGYIEVGNAPVVDFEANPSLGPIPLNVQFTDKSNNNPVTWKWDFTSDGTVDSTAQNPSTTYPNAGSYSVTLNVTNYYGFNVTTKTGFISAGNVPVADFNADKTIVLLNEDVHFTDLTTYSPNAWNWNFGDGTFSSQQNPTHSYSVAGIYTITLTASSPYGNSTKTKTSYINVGSKPVAAFHGNPVTGVTPLQVIFTDDSVGASTWEWDFNNDGVVDSTSRNPSYTYSSPGTYSVRLAVTNIFGSDQILKAGYITTDYVPVANFSGNPTEGGVPLTVVFTDTTENHPTSWSWDFGDGTTSTEQNPTHQYTNGGTYTVSLTAASSYGSDIETKTGYVILHPVPQSAISANPDKGYSPLTVTFADASTGSPTAWAWNFGDGTTSADQNPGQHTFTSSCTVSLTVSNIWGSTTSTHKITIEKQPGGGPEPDINLDLHTDSAVPDGAKSIALSGHTTGTNPPSEVWFTYGAMSNTYSSTTERQSIGSSPASFNFSATEGFYPGSALYVRAASDSGMGNELVVLIPTVAPITQTTYGVHSDTIIESWFDPMAMMQEAPKAYGEQMGAPTDETGTLIFWGFVISCIFIVLYLRSENVFTPALLGMVLGWVLLNFVPGDFKIMGQALLVVALGAMLFTIIKGRIR